jgi:hypothetical protein
MSEKRHWDIVITRRKPTGVRRDGSLYTGWGYWHETITDERVEQALTAFSQPAIGKWDEDPDYFYVSWGTEDQVEGLILHKNEFVDIRIIAVPPITPDEVSADE